MRASTAVLIRGFTITPSLNPLLNSTEAGIYVWWNSYNCIITECILAYFNDTSISRTYYGIRLSGTQCTAHRNTMKNNLFGISLDGPQCTVYGNIIENNNYGVYSYRYDGNGDNIIYENTITNNYMGVYCYHYLGNGNNLAKAYENDIINNDYGVYLYKSTNNKFYHNNFVDNTQQVYLPTPGNANSWDNSVEGNYWSNYVGVDSQPNGIGDNPYVMDGSNQDNYPLMGMFSDFTATLECHVQTVCNSTISDFQFSGTAVSFDVTGEDGTIGFCRVCIPHSLLGEPYSILVNGQPPLYVNYNLLENGTHRWIYFTYKHSTKEVIIVPEFPSFIVMPMFMIATLLAIACKRKRFL